MRICFSCRVEVEDGLPVVAVNSDVACARCYGAYLRLQTPLSFEEWRAGEAERFGFDPYLERDAEVALSAAGAAALIPVGRSALGALAALRDRTGRPSDELIAAGLSLLAGQLDDVEESANRMGALARMVGAAVAAAMKGETP